MRLRPPLSVPAAGATLVVALALLVAACGGDDDGAATETAAPTTTTTAAATTTTSGDTEALADGSGCTPGEGDLPDGEWFGYVDMAGETEIAFDLACWFSEPAATVAAAEDGDESPPPNGYHIRNENPALRIITVAGGAQVAWMPNPGDATEQTVTYGDWLVMREGRDFQPAVWVTIAGGMATGLREQYQP